jgi:hypothetical protein
VDVTVPPGWTQVESPDFAMAYLGPLEHDFRATFAVSTEDFDPPTPAGLAAVLAQVREEQAVTYDGFELLAEREDEIDGVYAWVEHYRWTPPPPTAPMTHLLALLVVSPGHLVKVDGVCLTERAGTDLPSLDAMVGTLRFDG